MKISSRPASTNAVSSSPLLDLTLEELEYIGALLYITRLGKGTYANAAYTLLTRLEDALGEDFSQVAAGKVDAYFSVLEADGCSIEIQHPASNICIEV